MTRRRPPRFSQSLKILELLEDGDWHTAEELARIAPGHVIARLRALWQRGYETEVRLSPDGAAYRLLSERENPSSRSESGPLPQAGATAESSVWSRPLPWWERNEGSLRA